MDAIRAAGPTLAVPAADSGAATATTGTLMLHRQTCPLPVRVLYPVLNREGTGWPILGADGPCLSAEGAAIPQPSPAGWDNRPSFVRALTGRDSIRPLMPKAISTLQAARATRQTTQAGGLG